MKRAADNIDMDDAPTKKPRLQSDEDSGYGLVTNNQTSIQALPLDILANHIFKFFDFKYWLRRLVPVCKLWDLAAVRSNLDKQVILNRVTNDNESLLRGYIELMKKYGITTLTLKDCAAELTSIILINASAKLSTLNIESKIKTDFPGFSKSKKSEEKMQLDSVPVASQQFHNITTVAIPITQVSQLTSFPNAARVLIHGTIQTINEIIGVFPSVKQLEITGDREFLENISNLKSLLQRFPNARILYMNSPARNLKFITMLWDYLSKAAAFELGVTIHCKFHHQFDTMFDLTAITYHGYYNAYGITPLMQLKGVAHPESLERMLNSMTDLTLEYEEDFRHRSPAFNFPRMMQRQNPQHLKTKEDVTKVLKLCSDRKLLPFWEDVLYQLKYLNDKTIALKTVKSASIEQLTLDDPNRFKGCETLLQQFKLDQIVDEIGIDKSKAIINVRNPKKKEKGEFILQAIPFQDIEKFQDLIETQNITDMLDHLLYHYNGNQKGAQYKSMLMLDKIFTTRNNLPCGPDTTLSPHSQTYLVTHFVKNGYDCVDKVIQQATIDLEAISINQHQSILTYAIKCFSLNLFKMVLKTGKLDVNRPDNSGRTPLVAAIEYKDQNFVRSLLKHGADPNIAGNTLLPINECLKRREGLLETLQYLVDYKCDVNKRDFDDHGKTAYPLSMALRLNCSYAIIKYLIDNGADPLVVDDAGNTLLKVLLRRKDSSNFQEKFQLFSQLVGVNQPNALGRTALHTALVCRSPIDILTKIIQLGGDVNLPDIQGKTPLMYSVIFPSDVHLSSCKLLMGTNTIDIKAKTKLGLSFVPYVVSYCDNASIEAVFEDPQFVKIIEPYMTPENIEFVANECKQLIDPTREMSALFGKITGHVTLTKFFIETLGLDPNITDANGNTLLSIIELTSKHKIEVFEYLINKGADVDASSNKMGNTVLIKELSYNSLQPWKWHKIQLLIQHGASITKKNNNGISAMDLDLLVATRYTTEKCPDYTDGHKSLPTVSFIELRASKK